jgi:hypothetical protein
MASQSPRCPASISQNTSAKPNSHHLTYDFIQGRVSSSANTALPLKRKCYASRMKLMTTIRWCAVIAAFLSGIIMLLEQLGSWAWNGMNLATSSYLIVTCAGLVAVISSLCITKSNQRGFAMFVIGSSVALSALSSFFLINQVFQSDISRGGPLYVDGVPLNMSAIYALSAFACAVVAAHALWSSKRSPEEGI